MLWCRLAGPFERQAHYLEIMRISGFGHIFCSNPPFFRTSEMSGRKLWDLTRHFLPMLIAAATGGLLSITAGFLVAQRENRYAELEFRAIAENHYMVLENGLKEYLNKLVTLRALFDSSDGQVTRKEFETFARPHLQSSSAIQTLSWVPRVPAHERAAYEIAAAIDGVKGYHFKSATADGGMVASGAQEEYYPIFYSTVPKTSRLYGLDLRSEPPTLAELEGARDDDRLGFSTVPELVSADGKQHGYIFSLPVYQPGLPHDAIESRRRNLAGFVHGSFITAKMIQSVLLATTIPRGLDMFFFEPESVSNDPPFHVQSSRLRSQPAEPKTLAALRDMPHWSRQLTAGKAPWATLVTVPMPGGPLTTRHDRAWIILVSGLLLSMLVVAYLWALGRYARQVEYLASTDPLTNLANRRAFSERLTIGLAASRQGATPFAVLFLDLDGFKDVNDTLGHAVGDTLLRQIGERLNETASTDDFVARFGGDEFAILQADASDPLAAATLATRVGESLAAPFLIQGHKVRVTASIGISSYSADMAAEGMMKQADLALYRAKDDGGNCFRSHTGVLDQQVHLRVTLAEELRLAIGTAELELYYQPLVEIVSRKIVGLEALVRWNHPTRGLIMPSIFIPIAERTGAIVALGHWVFEEACSQLKQWRDKGIAPQVLAVNVSGVQFKSASELELDIANTLEKWGINSGIEIELTETVLMEVTQKQGDALERLRQLGVRIAIDDFGTGYSSLKYLTIYPVNRLKVAQELVFRITTDARNATVVRAAIRLANELGIEVIAEGVETEAQANFLVAAGCAYAQGYYFSRPVNAERAMELLQQGKIEFTGMPTLRPSSAVA